MSTYENFARQLINVADYVRDNKISFGEIPFDNVMEMVRQIYDIRPGNGEYYVKLYGTLLIKGLESGDRECVAAVLTLVAKHMEILSKDGIEINQKIFEKIYLQCRLAHLLNCEKVKKWHEINVGEAKVPFNGRGVIYSAITGDYDQVKEPRYVNPQLDYILFTNNPKITSSVWQVRLVENPEQLDNVRLARRIKILGHEYLPEYDYSIWVDGKLEIDGNLREYVEEYRRKEPILCFTHYDNECVYQEKITCVALKKDDPEVMERQMQRYRDEGYPVNNGLVESGIMVRELKNERVQQVMKTWWEEIVHGSRRDQLSFNYACWKNDFVYDTTDLFIYENKYVTTHNHNA